MFLWKKQAIISNVMRKSVNLPEKTNSLLNIYTAVVLTPVYPDLVSVAINIVINLTSSFQNVLSFTN